MSSAEGVTKGITGCLDSSYAQLVSDQRQKEEEQEEEKEKPRSMPDSMSKQTSSHWQTTCNMFVVVVVTVLLLLLQLICCHMAQRRVAYQFYLLSHYLIDLTAFVVVVVVCLARISISVVD